MIAEVVDYGCYQLKKLESETGLICREPFALILRVGKNGCAQGDDLRTFLAHFVAALPQIDFPRAHLHLSDIVATKPEGCARLFSELT